MAVAERNDYGCLGDQTFRCAINYTTLLPESMLKLIISICSVLFYGFSALAQQQDTTIQLPNRLVISQIRNSAKQVTIDSNGLTSIVCLLKSDSLIREQQRQLSGKLIGYTDTSLILHVDQESAITYYRNGTMETFYYWKSEDTTKWHIDTIRFEEIHTLSFDRGKFKQVRGILQSTAYLYIIGNIAVLVTVFIVPKTYGSLVTGKNLMVTTGVALGSGMASFLFYPKEFRLANQPKHRKKIRWKIEVR
jgi:hypothetical protein